MLSLDTPQIDGDFLLHLSISGLAAIMPQQDVFGGDRCIGFQLEYPMSIFLLAFQKRMGRPPDRRVNPGRP
jgi:hypothetical protein